MTPQPAARRRSDVGVVWFRRDLRVADNPALVEAIEAHKRVVPLFVWDPVLVSRAGAPRLAFLHGCLKDLARSFGGELVIRSGDPVDVVPRLADEFDAERIWCAEDFGPYGSSRDLAVSDALASHDRLLCRVGSAYAVSPGELLTGHHQPYRVFTPFSKAWSASGWDSPLNEPGTNGSIMAGATSDPLPRPPSMGASLPRPGEAAARGRLEQFVEDSIEHYDDQRDRPDLEGTSRLSPYLKFGCLHPRQVLAQLDLINPAHRRFQTELCWREFYADVLHHRPDSARAAYRREWHAFPTDSGNEAKARFETWANGQTGYPIVDAGMRQLLGEGWMHNRVRMIVASFLVKDLHIDWRAGARWFMQHLVDGDIASNQHGWQWVAGTGTDAAPYFRVFNPVAQGKRFDPHGTYVRRWVPELAGMADDTIHEPWKAASSLLVPEPAYPPPIVDHAAEREEALARYGALRAASRV
ncbi:MAG TPA: deoxyribodipyrimidine photo-lyase [Acidimicrobiales bacterium]|nr:deoxyribodipyrimidine photo-lyase [Acidimicrobiales bacterium]